MDRQLYQRFVALNAVGRRSEATAAVTAFVASFRSLIEKQQFAEEFLTGDIPRCVEVGAELAICIRNGWLSLTQSGSAFGKRIR